MSEQRRIDLLFAVAVRMFALARLSRRAAPAVAMVLVVVVAVHGTLGGVDVASVPRLAMDVPPGFAQPAARTHAHASASPREVADRSEMLAAPIVSETPLRPVPRLDKEQENIARFIAQRYRVGLDATSEFVYHAYRAARDVKVDPMLVLAVMSVESSFNPRAQSAVGAQGLMQVLTRVHTEKFMPFGGIPAAFDPVANIRVGSAILKEYIKREGTVEGALKSYVGAALAEHDGGYGSKVLNARERIAAAAAGKPIPPETVVTPRPAAAEAEPKTQPVSLIVETRTPITDESRAAAAAEPSDAHRVPQGQKGPGEI
ncbi:MAG: lytic transglycosylase domain-containing protein [Burkholderiaceae bacterium]|jgi:soluble lytic murein transglycosylase-like protein|nr:lytic transglycosylase domain-containing protein [Burkholderiales bacterium]MCZ8105592.1 lytic transglycosylase domain-containing protein [Burkholderiales bacterium]MCZ8337765.1 lytic transglycosylase domain-containing protein [Burkholderiaceae bacterium]